MDVMIDPPDGEKYGFPKRLAMENEAVLSFDMKAWLVANGYPQEEIDKYEDMFYVTVRDVH